MRILVTGATGFIGSAVVAELLAAGHEVVGLARSQEAVDRLAQAGASAHRGQLTDLHSLEAGVRACDAAAHLAFIHDFSKYRDNGEIDRLAVTAMTGALEGSGKPFVLTSGITVTYPGAGRRRGQATLADGVGVGGTRATPVPGEEDNIGSGLQPATALEPVSPEQKITEEDDARLDSPSAVRTPSEEVVLAAAQRGVRSSIVRLPPSVHGPGDRAFVPALIDIARRAGVSAYVGLGTNRWPAVHRLDAARLFRLALEKAASGTRLHGVAEEGLPVRTIAEAIGEGLGVPVLSIPAPAAAAHFGWLAPFVVLDTPASSHLTQQRLGWRPRENGLLQDLRESGYFI